ncbi:MAG: leucine-rich repeat protein, partial [Oscillospiraceae bacterium]|nr:leucine-rich repeat protein [Oscillospiraceae bacterium]
EYAEFIGCENLASVSIPTSVTSIDSQAFEGCIALNNLVIPASVTFIGRIVTENGVSSTIGTTVFKDCNALTNVTFLGTVEQWKAVKGIFNLGSRVIKCSDGDYEPA